eukprot:538410-Pleurochrysis_carterae.AAC.1
MSWREQQNVQECAVGGGRLGGGHLGGGEWEGPRDGGGWEKADGCQSASIGKRAIDGGGTGGAMASPSCNAGADDSIASRAVAGGRYIDGEEGNEEPSTDLGHAQTWFVQRLRRTRHMCMLLTRSR